MLHIAVVDDDLEAVNEMIMQIDKGLVFKNVSFAVDRYSDSKLVQKNQAKYDVFFLDIDMPNIDGITLAKIIKKNNISSIIIFMTNRNDLMHYSFSVHPFYFIRKTHFDEDCKILFPLLMERLNKIKKDILLEINGRKKRVNISTIVYIESFNHYINIHLNNEEIIKIKKKLSVILSEIGTENIIQIHKSFLVNMIYIDYIKENQLYIVNNIKLPIGRKHKNLTISKYESYLL